MGKFKWIGILLIIAGILIITVGGRTKKTIKFVEPV